jgi:transglutaminase-like putative cysteine protease
VRLSITATADYDLPAETFLTLMVEPKLNGEAHRVTTESLRTTPTGFSAIDADPYGNVVRRLVAPPGFFSFDYSGTVEAEPNLPVPDDAPEVAPRDLPAELLTFTLPSRYCQSDKLARLATGEFGGLTPGGGRVNAVAGWIRSRVEYRYGTTDAMTSAYDTVTQRVGVCRDFAHLVVAFCRALGVPARYVSGYCLGLEPPDFHAWAQVWLGGRWHNVDATFEGVRPALVPIAFGRDAADVAMVTLWGAATLREQSVSVREG